MVQLVGMTIPKDKHIFNHLVIHDEYWMRVRMLVRDYNRMYSHKKNSIYRMTNSRAIDLLIEKFLTDPNRDKILKIPKIISINKMEFYPSLHEGRGRTLFLDKNKSDVINKIKFSCNKYKNTDCTITVADVIIYLIEKYITDVRSELCLKPVEQQPPFDPRDMVAWIQKIDEGVG